MDERVCKILEFDIIKEELARLTSCEKAKQTALALMPSSDRETVLRTLNETDDAVALIMRKGRPPLGGLRDIGLSIKRAQTGSMLSFAELLSAAGILKAARRLRNYSAGEERSMAEASAGDDGGTGTETGQVNLIEEMIGQLGEDYRMESRIYRCILSEDEMADDASFALAEIRKQILDRQNYIKEKLGEFVRSSKNSKAIQDGLVTMRGDRYCIPVKVEYRSEFPGMVHDMSSSGQTVFIEPAFVVDANNKIRELRVRETQEIERITLELSGEIGARADMLLADAELISYIDFTFAKAGLALAQNAQKPEINEKGIIRIVNGRHPLIDKHKVVPVTIRLGEGYTALIVTGPNTGGKTVTLKTAGLFTLMMQAGLLVPCDAGSELSIYRNVFADIGDEQSIAQSLSTFSSHMKNIVEILSHCDDRSLVLFDELGAGTDPAEGAALATSILECVHQMGASLMATTHYSELKVFTSTTPGFENACCEFSVETLAPTYRLIIGMPGKSNAFAISERLGLDKTVIERAREFLSSEDIRFEDMLAGIEKRREEIERERNEIQRLREEAERLKAEMSAEREKFAKQKNAMVAKAREEAGKLLRESKQTADELLAELRRAAAEGSREALRAGEAAGRALSDLKNETEAGLYTGLGGDAETGEAADTVRAGQTVYVVSIDGDATVLKETDKDGNVYIQAGIIKMYVPLSDIRIRREAAGEENSGKAGKQKRSAAAAPGGESVNVAKAAGVKTELDLRGFTGEEARAAVDKYLDDATVAGLSVCRIIHGKGTGKLRREIQEMLKRDKRVRTFRLGEYGEGDSGVTVAELRR